MYNEYLIENKKRFIEVLLEVGIHSYLSEFLVEDYSVELVKDMNFDLITLVIYNTANGYHKRVEHYYVIFGESVVSYQNPKNSILDSIARIFTKLLVENGFIYMLEPIKSSFSHPELSDGS